MNHATPAILLLLILALFLQALPRALAMAVALTGEVVVFLLECGEQLYSEGQQLRALVRP